MSWTLQNQVRQNAAAGLYKSIYETAVMQALASHAHDDGDSCYPSLATLAAESQCSQCTVWRVLKKFREQGWVTVKATGRSNHYKILSHGRIVIPGTPSRAGAGAGAGARTLPLQRAKSAFAQSKTSLCTEINESYKQSNQGNNNKSVVVLSEPGTEEEGSQTRSTQTGNGARSLPAEEKRADHLVSCPVQCGNGTSRLRSAPSATPREAVQHHALQSNGNVITGNVTEDRLVGYGVSRSQIRELISRYDDARIELQLEALEFRLAKGGSRAPANPGGWLVEAIRENYPMPKGFKSKAQLAEETRQQAEKTEKAKEIIRRQEAHEEAQREREDAEWELNQSYIQEHLRPLNAEERLTLGVDAFEGSSLPLGQGQGSPRLIRKLIRDIIDQHVLDILNGSIER